MTAPAAPLVDYVCARDGCTNQTVWPAKAAVRGWFVITDRRGVLHVICPTHAPHERNPR